jgi:hypothetical protein
MSNSQQQTLEIGFEAFLQELPAEYHPLAYEFKVFTRGRKFKSPADVMQAVMDYCGLDFSLREVAGHFSLLEERVSDTAVHKRLKACLPWVKALLERMFGSCSEGLIAGGLRFVVVDGSTVQVPGAQGTSYRLHIAIDLVKLEILHVEVTDAHEGESLERYPLKEGDVVIVDRGYNQPAALINQAAQGVCVVLRYNPHGMNLYDEQMQKVDWERVLKAADGQPVCISVQVPKDGEVTEAHVHATPLPQEQAAGARRRARAAAKKKGRTAKARTLFLAGWVLIFSGVPPEILNTETIAELYRVRWQVEMCQTQPIKMTWCPLRHVFRALPCLRGKLKREHVVDVNLVAGHHDFTDQAPGHGLTVLKRELLQILAQQLAKGLGMVHDLLPMKRLLLTAG